MLWNHWYVLSRAADSLDRRWHPGVIPFGYLTDGFIALTASSILRRNKIIPRPCLISHHALWGASMTCHKRFYTLRLLTETQLGTTSWFLVSIVQNEAQRSIFSIILSLFYKPLRSDDFMQIFFSFSFEIEAQQCYDPQILSLTQNVRRSGDVT